MKNKESWGTGGTRGGMTKDVPHRRNTYRFFLRLAGLLVALFLEARAGASRSPLVGKGARDLGASFDGGGPRLSLV